MIVVEGVGLPPGTYEVLTSEISRTEDGFYKGFSQQDYLVGTSLGSVVVRDDGLLTVTVKLIGQRSRTGCRYIWVADFTGLLPGQSSNKPSYSSPIWAQ